MALSDVPAFLFKIRKRSKLTQEELADLIKMDQVTVSLHERGERGPNLDLIQRWAEACGGRADLVLQMPGEVPATAPLLDAVAGMAPEQLVLIVRAVNALAAFPAEQLLLKVEVLELEGKQATRFAREQPITPYKAG